MDRRKFISAFAGAVASVSIGLKLSQGMPALNLVDPKHYPYRTRHTMWVNSNKLYTAMREGWTYDTSLMSGWVSINDRAEFYHLMKR